MPKKKKEEEQIEKTNEEIIPSHEDSPEEIEEEALIEEPAPLHEDSPEEIAAAKALLEELGQSDEMAEWFGEEAAKAPVSHEPLEPVKGMVYLKQTLAYIEIRVEDEAFVLKEEPVIFAPLGVDGNPEEAEFVYPIYDFGDRLIASKGTESLFGGQSMIKMFYTIDKMISIWYEKIKQKDESGGKKGKGGSGEVKVYLDGFELCLRKAFEVIINLADNWIVMNYDPGEWGNRYLDILQKLNEKGYSYPPPAPRDYYRYGVHGKKTKISTP